MAKLLDTNSKDLTNFTEYQNTFMRQGAYPLDAYSLFKSYEEAKLYAQGNLEQDIPANPAAYVGQTLVVANKDSVKQYIIVDEAGTLQLAGGGTTRKIKVEKNKGITIPLKPNTSKINITFDGRVVDNKYA
jgi:hypothetical protein